MLFSESELASRSEFAVPMCGACKLHRFCDHPKMKPVGPKGARILIVGDQPSPSDDKEGQFWQGSRGEILLFSLRAAGTDITECRYTCGLICAGGADDEENAKRVPYCRPNLLEEIERTQPEIIIPCGKIALEAVLGPIWKEDAGSIRQWAGWQIPGRRWNAWICPTFSPKSCTKHKDAPAHKLAFDTHIRHAVGIEGRPFKQTADKKSDNWRVLRLFDDEAVEARVENILNQGVISLDYETDRLKPDNKAAKIVSVGFGWKNLDGKVVAAAWLLDTPRKIEACKRVLFSQIPKIGANTKFENRWSLAKFGNLVQNWVWDTQTVAHALDNRQGVTSVKFQAFVRLGVEPYNEHISHHFDVKGGNKQNAIRKIPVDDLLLYNGLDCVYEYQIAMKQAKELGVSL